jgi:zinc and cadmium transporter
MFALGSVAVVSAVSLVGVFTLSLNEAVLRKYVFTLVSLAVGALLGDAFIHLIPEAFEEFEGGIEAPLAVIGGVLAFFILEKVMHWHHHHHSPDEECVSAPTGPMILVADGVHNFIDGLIIGSSYLVGIEVGIATTLAVVLHEIPQEIGDFGVLVHSGYGVRKALWLNALSSLTAVAGVFIAIVAGAASELFALWLLPFAAGGFIYIAMSDLVPELHKTKEGSHSALQIAAVIIGVGAMLLLLAIE